MPVVESRLDRWRWWLVEWRPGWWPAWLDWPSKPLLAPDSPWHLRLSVARVVSAIAGVLLFAFVIERSVFVAVLLVHLVLAILDVRHDLRRRRATRSL